MTNSHSTPKRLIVFLVSVILIVALAVGGTIAYLHAETGVVTNTFAPGTGGIEINEDIKDEVKKQITVKNTGNIPVLVRMAIVINTVDENGNVIENPEPPVVVGYNEGNWVRMPDGFYYYKGAVGAGGATQDFLKSDLSYKGRSVDVIAQTIQAAGDVEKASWGFDFNPADGSWN